MHSLAVRVEPAVDEGLMGYLSRLEGANALPANELLRHFKTMSEEDLLHLTFTGKRPPGWAAEAAEIGHPSTRPVRVWSHKVWKYCPPCLRSDCYWRGQWSLTLVSCCPLHEIRLVDHCSSCGKRIVRRALLDFCCAECGQPLANGIAHATHSRGALWLATELSDRLNDVRRKKLNDISALGLVELHELALRIGLRATRTERLKPLKVKDASLIAEALPIAREAGGILLAWPTGMRQFLANLRTQNSQRGRWRIQKAVGPLYRDIYKNLGDRCFDFVRSEFEAYIGEEWEAPLARRNRNLSPWIVRRHSWLSIGSAASRIGVPPSLVRRLVGSGELRANEIEHSSGRVSRSVDLNGLTAIRTTLRSALSLQQTAQRLCLGTERVRQLLSAGILRSIGGRPRPGEQWWIDEQSLPVPATSVKRRLKVADCGSIAITDVAKYLVADADTFVDLIGAICIGSMSVGRGHDAARLGEWCVNRAELEAWLLGRRGRRGISLAEAATELGVKQEVAYALSRAGILKTDVVRVGRRYARRVSSEALVEFSNRYVFNTELARRAGTSPRHLAHSLLASGINAIAGPTVTTCRCRQYVWPRSRRILDVARTASL